MPQQKETGGQKEIKQGRIFISYFKFWLVYKTKESREGWPLLTVETEQMETYGVQIKGIRCSFLICFVGLVLLVQEIFILPWLLWSAQYNIFFFLTKYTILIFMCSHLSPATWAGSRAGPPVSECVPAYKAAHRLCLGGFCDGIQKYCHQRCKHSRCAPCGGQEKNTLSSRKIILGVGKCTYML
jgi:hypothetical protein